MTTISRRGVLASATAAPMATLIAVLPEPPRSHRRVAAVEMCAKITSMLEATARSRDAAPCPLRPDRQCSREVLIGCLRG